MSPVQAILLFAATFHTSWFLPLLVNAQSNCELSLEVYEFAEDCSSGSSPKESGSVIADGTCREASSASWLPGIYRAECDSSGKVTFIDSGCSSLSACEETPTEACDNGDNSLNSWIYARISSPSYPTNGICFEASYTNSLGDNLEATFKFTGECNTDCGGSAPADPTDPPASPPTRSPVPPPTRSPVPPPTRSPVTPAPLEPPVTPAPVEPLPAAPTPVNEPPVQPPTGIPVNLSTQPPIEPPTGEPITPTPTKGPAQGGFVPSQPGAPVSMEVTAVPTTTPIVRDNDKIESTIYAALRFEPFDALLSVDKLARCGKLTSDFLQQETEISTATITKMSQTLEPLLSKRLLLQVRGLQQAQQALEIAFVLEGIHNDETTMEVLFVGAFDTQTEWSRYLSTLQAQLDEFKNVELVQAKIVDESPDGGSGDSSNNAGVLAGVLVAVVATVLLSGLFVWRRQKKSKRLGQLESPGMGDPLPSKLPKEVTSSSSDPNSAPLQQWTNEIMLDLHAADDVSTLEGGTLPDNATIGRLYDDHTATVDPNSYHHAAYGRHGAPDEGTADEGTSLSKVSQIGSFASVSRFMELNDDTSFEAQFSPNGMAPLEEVIGGRVKPFVVEASPGVKLGMVIESETTVGLPYVRAVRSDSEFRNRVQEGDLVISVNRHDVTNMTAMEVSELISAKQFEHRTLVFGRPEKKLHLPLK